MARTSPPAQYQSTAQETAGAWREIVALTSGAQPEVSISDDSVPKEKRLPVVLIGAPK
ncbi:hypothetical protein [Streptomyces sp900116325]|uniref:hypothetical protein n=1 Tax=Streptomyces sp. 900116325 TaxID=3154295 RepID=UPI0033FB6080